MREVLALLVGLAILAGAGWTVRERERQLVEGRLVLLELAPVDPRSLMQGDYMAVRFKVLDAAFGRGRSLAVEDGRLVLRVDARGVGQYVRRDGGEPLARDEVALRYRVRNGEARLATNAFFFPEGQGKVYEGARYGEARVSATGEVLLSGLRGPALEPLGRRDLVAQDADKKS
jgi:uncharacterized membrane-anchored protein